MSRGGLSRPGRHHAAARAAARLLGGAQGARAGRAASRWSPRRSSSPTASARRRSSPPNLDPEWEQISPLRVREQVVGHDRDPGGLGLRSRLGTTTALPASRAARRSAVSPTCPSSSATRRLSATCFAGAVYAAWRRPPAGARRRRSGSRPGPLGQPRRPRAPGGRLDHGDPHRPGGRRAACSGRQLRRSPDHRRRYDDPLGRGVHRGRSGTRLKRTSPGAECIFLQGCAGDLAPLDWWFGDYEASPHGYEARDRLGRRIGEAALELYPGIETSADARVATGSKWLDLRRRRHAYDADEIRAQPASRGAFRSRSGPRSGGPRCTR